MRRGKAPVPTPPPDPAIAAAEEVRKQQAAALVRERYLKEQGRRDKSFTGTGVRRAGLKI